MYGLIKTTLIIALTNNTYAPELSSASMTAARISRLQALHAITQDTGKSNLANQQILEKAITKYEQENPTQAAEQQAEAEAKYAPAVKFFAQFSKTQS